MAKITKKTFIEIDFTGKIKENGAVFDTTIKKVALDNNLNPNSKYEPAVICVGEGYIFKKLEDSLIGKGIGNKVKVELSAEEAFGKKDSKKIHLLPASVFLKQKIRPSIGLQVNVNNMMGIIRTVTGGRCMVDFNHPLSGKDLVYNIKINKLVVDDIKKINSVIKSELAIEDFKIEKKEKDIVVKFGEKVNKFLNAEMKGRITKRVKELTVKDIKIV